MCQWLQAALGVQYRLYHRATNEQLPAGRDRAMFQQRKNFSDFRGLHGPRNVCGDVFVVITLRVQVVDA